MKIIVEIGHPAHVHHFKNMIWNLEKHGNEVKIVAKDKDVTLKLLKAYGFKYEILGRNYNILLNKAYGLIKTDCRLFKIAKKFKPDLFVSRASPHSAHVSRLVNRPHIAFCDTEHATLNDMLAYPFTDVICTPSCYKKRLNPKKHVIFDGYKELAYLHPNYFKPDSSVLDDLGLSKEDKFIIMRLISWEATHDIHSKGFSHNFLEKAVKSLEEYGHVFITSEQRLDKNLEKYKIQIPPEKLHSALYYASLYFGEGGTTAVEAALIGTPAVHLEALKLKSDKIVCITEKIGYLDELVNKYQMFYTFTDQNQALDKCLEIVQNDNVKKELLKKREKLLKDKIDVTKFMTEFIENYPERLRNLKNEN